MLERFDWLGEIFFAYWLCWDTGEQQRMSKLILLLRWHYPPFSSSSYMQNRNTKDPAAEP
jgi:hypothetical protein